MATPKIENNDTGIIITAAAMAWHVADGKWRRLVKHGENQHRMAAKITISIAAAASEKAYGSGISGESSMAAASIIKISAWQHGIAQHSNVCTIWRRMKKRISMAVSMWPRHAGIGGVIEALRIVQPRVCSIINMVSRCAHVWRGGIAAPHNAARAAERNKQARWRVTSWYGISNRQQQHVALPVNRGLYAGINMA